MTDLTEIGAAVRAHRKKLKLTQRELAGRGRISRALLADLEAGRLPEMGIRKLLRVLHAVHLDLRITALNLKRPTFEDLVQEENAR